MAAQPPCPHALPPWGAPYGWTLLTTAPHGPPLQCPPAEHAAGLLASLVASTLHPDSSLAVTTTESSALDEAKTCSYLTKP